MVKNNINEGWFDNSYSKLLDQLKRSYNQLEIIKKKYNYSVSGNETELVKRILDRIFHNINDTKKYVNKFNESEENKNGFMSQLNFKLFFSYLDNCVNLSYKINKELTKNPNKYNINFDSIIREIRQIWNLFKTTNLYDESQYSIKNNSIKNNKINSRTSQYSKNQSATNNELDNDDVYNYPANNHVPVNGTRSNNVNFKPIGVKVTQYSNNQPDDEEIPDRNKLVTKNKPIKNNMQFDRNKLVTKNKQVKNNLMQQNRNDGESDIHESTKLNKLENKLNELFGLSKKEKKQKELNNRIELALQEANKFNLEKLVGQLGSHEDNNESNVAVKKIINYRLRDAITAMPNLSKLLPKLFENSGAYDINYIKNGNKIQNCFIPRNFGAICVTNGELNKEKFIENINKLLNDLKNKFKKYIFTDVD